MTLSVTVSFEDRGDLGFVPVAIEGEPLIEVRDPRYTVSDSFVWACPHCGDEWDQGLESILCHRFAHRCGEEPGLRSRSGPR